MSIESTFGRVDNPKKGKTVKEIRCTCKECGKVWHYLPSEEQSDQCSSCGNAMVGCGSCGSVFAPYYLNKSKDYASQMNKYKKCQSCGSINITKEELKHEF